MPGIPGVRVYLSEGGAEGRGEAGGVFYLGDGPDQMLAAIEQVRPEIERGADRAVLMDMLPACGARNALDSALWDLEARLTGQPVWRLAGLSRPRPVTTAYTISAASPEVVAGRLAEYGDARALKLKLEGDVEADRQRLRLIRRARPDVWLMADANEGYTPASLEQLLPDLVAAAVALLEQPLPRGQEDALQELNLPLPVAADESLQDLSELPRLIGRFQVANIKLDKCGGLTEGLMMAREARRLGLGVMVGNMGGSSIAAAPAWLLAQLCDHVDLDGPMHLADDVPCGARYEAGRVSVPDSVWGHPQGS